MATRRNDGTAPERASQAKVSEADIIRKMRVALDILKAKWQEAEGAWAIADFLGAATSEDHWMHAIAEAERLSNPYMAAAAKKRA